MAVSEAVGAGMPTLVADYPLGRLLAEKELPSSASARRKALPGDRAALVQGRTGNLAPGKGPRHGTPIVGHAGDSLDGGGVSSASQASRLVEGGALRVNK